MPALTDRTEIRARLERDPYWSLYALCDLEPYHFAHASWLRPEPDAGGIALLYREFAPPIFAFVGNPEEARAVLAEACEPDLYLHVRPEIVAVASDLYADVTAREMLRMALDPERFQPAPGPARRLGPADLPALERLYGSGAEKERPDFFFPSMLERGVFHGLWEDGELAAVAGTHLAAPSVQAAAIGNVFTRPDRRGRGLGRITTSAVIDELLDRGMTRIGLCVAPANLGARRAYEALGFQVHCTYCEGRASGLR